MSATAELEKNSEDTVNSGTLITNAADSAANNAPDPTTEKPKTTRHRRTFDDIMADAMKPITDDFGPAAKLSAIAEATKTMGEAKTRSEAAVVGFSNALAKLKTEEKEAIKAYAATL